MKQLIDITDEDILEVVNRIHILTENSVIGRNGCFPNISFRDSFVKYGDCHIDVLLVSQDIIRVCNTESICRLHLHNNSIWFEEYDKFLDPHTYNKNHFFGYLKLQELGYQLPTEPQWT